MVSGWTPMSDVSVKRFILDTQDEVIYIIQTGFDDRWVVVFEDAYEISLGSTFIGGKKEIEQKFNIEL